MALNEIGEGPSTTKSFDPSLIQVCPAQATTTILFLIVPVVVFLLCLGIATFFLHKKKMFCCRGEKIPVGNETEANETAKNDTSDIYGNIYGVYENRELRQSRSDQAVRPYTTNGYLSTYQ